MAEAVSHLDLLWRVCRKHGWALLLSATHETRFGMLGQARLNATVLEHLDVVEAGVGPTRTARIRSGDLVGRVSLNPFGSDAEQAAGELLAALEQNHLIDAEAA